MTQTSSLRPQKTAMLVAQRIVADIQRRGNTVGDRLPPERVMLEEYEIGRGTLRESLRFSWSFRESSRSDRVRAAEPVVQQPDGSGLATALTLLLQFENAPFRTIAESRTGLEPMMAQLAASRMSEDEIARLKYSVDQMGEHIGDEAEFLEMNKRFHDIIAHGSGNVMFGYLVESLLGMLDGSAIGIDYPEHRRIAVHKAHASIYEAIAARDPEASGKAMHEHIAAYARYAEKKFPELLDMPISWTAR